MQTLFVIYWNVYSAILLRHSIFERIYSYIKIVVHFIFITINVDNVIRKYK